MHQARLPGGAELPVCLSRETVRAYEPRTAAVDLAAAQVLLEQMETMERRGTTFQDKQTQDIRIRYVAPVVITVLTIGLMAAVMALIAWGYAADPDAAPPPALLAVIAAIPAAVACGVLLALVQRIREIGRRELDDARKF